MGDHRGRGPVRGAAGAEQPSGNSGAEATHRGHVCWATAGTVGLPRGRARCAHAPLATHQTAASRLKTHRATVTWDRKVGAGEPGAGWKPRGPPLGGHGGSRISPGSILGLIPLEPVGCRFLIFLPSQSFGQQTSVRLGPAGLTAHICLRKPPGQGRGTQDRGEGTAWRCAQQQEAARGTPGPTSARRRRPEQVREMQVWGGGRGACLDCHRLPQTVLSNCRRCPPCDGNRRGGLWRAGTGLCNKDLSWAPCTIPGSPLPTALEFPSERSIRRV